MDHVPSFGVAGLKGCDGNECEAVICGAFMDDVTFGLFHVYWLVDWLVALAECLGTGKPRPSQRGSGANIRGLKFKILLFSKNENQKS